MQASKRDFLRNAFKAGGVAALYSLGLSFVDVKRLFASDNYYQGSSGVVDDGGAGCDSCTGDLTFSWHMEDTDVTSGTPCGCSAGDTTATLNNSAAISSAQAQDGTNSLYCPSGSSTPANAEFSNTSNAIIQPDAGTVTFYVYVTSFVAGTRLWTMWTGPTDNIQCYMTGTGDGNIDILLWYRGTGSANVTANSNLSLNTWYQVTCKWREGAADPSIYVEANSASAQSDTDLSGASDDGTFYVGNNDGSKVGDFYIDNMKVYNSWQ